MTFHRIFNTTGVTSAAGTDYPSGTLVSNVGFQCDSSCPILSFLCSVLSFSFDRWVVPSWYLQTFTQTSWGRTVWTVTMAKSQPWVGVWKPQSLRWVHGVTLNGGHSCSGNIFDDLHVVKGGAWRPQWEHQQQERQETAIFHQMIYAEVEER